MTRSPQMRSQGVFPGNLILLYKEHGGFSNTGMQNVLSIGILLEFFIYSVHNASYLA